MKIQSESLTAARNKEQDEDFGRRLHSGRNDADDWVDPLVAEQVVEGGLTKVGEGPRTCLASLPSTRDFSARCRIRNDCHLSNAAFLRISALGCFVRSCSTSSVRS